MIANQRANARRLALDDIERIDARNLDLQLHPRVLVEQIERPLRGRIPVAVHRTGVAADPPQFGLQRARKIDRLRLIGLVRRRRQRGDLVFLRLLFGSGVLCIFGGFQPRGLRSLCFLGGFCCCLRALGFGKSCFCRGLRTLGFRDLRLFGLFRQFGGDAGFLGGFGLFGSLGLFRGLGAFDGEPCLLVLGCLGLVRGLDPRGFRRELVTLRFGKCGKEAGRILLDEGIPHRLGADLKREFVVRCIVAS